MAGKPGPEEVRRVVQEVLSLPEFRQQTDPSEWMRDLLLWLSRHVNLPSWLGWLMIVGVALGVVYLLVRLAQVRPAVGARARQARPASFTEVLDHQASTEAEALQLAQASLLRGDQRQALWVVHRVLLARRVQAGKLRFGPGKTNSAYVREAPDDALLQEATLAYEQAVYGHQQLDPAWMEALFAKIVKQR